MRIGVVGGGLMGSGIAEVCARAGVDVTVVEADAAAAERAQARIEKSLDRGVRSGKLSAEDRSAATERLAYSAQGRRGPSASSACTSSTPCRCCRSSRSCGRS